MTIDLEFILKLERNRLLQQILPLIYQLNKKHLKVEDDQLKYDLNVKLNEIIYLLNRF